MSRHSTVDDESQGPGIPGYRSFHPIAQGGYSIVYTAYQDRLDRTVAVKVISSDLRDAAAERRFTRECKTVGKLTGHPNIITVFEAGSTRDRRPFIAMQYLPAGSLADRVVQEGPLPVSEVLRTGAQIAEALQAAHDARILHRDLKPGNILISDRGEPVLSDFGIASRGFDADMSGSQGVLTPAYAAPEILQGVQATVASDLYGLGATLFALLTGEPPFGQWPGDNAVSMTLRILADDVQPIRRSDVPAVVEDQLHALLARDPLDRPRTAAAVANELRRLDAFLGHTHRRTPPTPLGTPTRITSPDGRVVFGAPFARRSSPPPPAEPSATDPLAVGYETASAASFGGGAEDRGTGPVRSFAPVANERGSRRRKPPGYGGTVPEPRADAPAPARPARGAGEVGDTAPDYPPTREQRPNRGLVAAVAVLGLIVAIFVAAAIFAPGGDDADTDATGPLPSSSPSPSPSPSSSPAAAISSSAVAAAGPTGLVASASDGGTTAVLSWTNGSVSENLVIQLSDARGLGALQTLPDGATTYKVPGLDPAQGYCFRVGVILGNDPATGVVAAWSGYACLRGAAPPA